MSGTLNLNFSPCKMFAKVATVLFVTAFVEAVSNPSSMECQPKRYIVFNYAEVSFFTAWRLCESYGFQLATVTNPLEDAELQRTLKNTDPHQLGPWWIAGTDLGNEGQFVWLSSGKAIEHQTGYRNFAPGQPDNRNGVEHCLEVGWSTETTRWTDKNCDEKKRFICEAREPLTC